MTWPLEPNDESLEDHDKLFKFHLNCAPNLSQQLFPIFNESKSHPYITQEMRIHILLYRVFCFSE